MIEKRFMSEMVRFRRLSLGSAESNFLNLIAAATNPISAYDIWVRLKEMAVSKPMAYKNVHVRVKKLHSYGLIQEVKEEKRYRKAIHYEVTNSGLFHYLLDSPLIPFVLKKYKDNLILKIILYEFFSVSTIDYFCTVVRILALNQYLKKCCQAILDRFEIYKRNRWKYKQSELVNDMNRLILNEMKNFAYQIVSTSNSKVKIKDIDIIALHQKYDEYSKNEKDQVIDILEVKNKDKVLYSKHLNQNNNSDDLENHKYLFPNMALKNDTRFMELLHEIKKEFDDGYSDFLK